MKKGTKLILAVLVMIVSASGAYAQATATSPASATIVSPISILKTIDMDFGNVAVQAAAGGTVVLTPASSRTSTGGVTLPATAGTVAAASFTVTGATGYTYAITLPATATISNGGNNMTVDGFTSTPSATGILTTGTQTLLVGATLNVGAGQAAGVYTTATPFSVTVNYN
jgi:hypothetical protein